MKPKTVKKSPMGHMWGQLWSTYGAYVVKFDFIFSDFVLKQRLR